MKIIVDCFGADEPIKVIQGAVSALEDKEIELVLAGAEGEITKALEGVEYDTSRVEILDAPSVITNMDVPTVALKTKADSSLVLAMKRLKQDPECVGLVSAGSTGAVLTAATILVGRIRGITRPALMPALPTVNDGKVYLIDCGANSDCKAPMLVQFGIMGNAYAQAVAGISNPRVALLANGTEDKKGNELIHETFPLMKESALNFVGNMEAREILSGNYDVIVADGFSGNIALKACEGTAVSIFDLLKKNIYGGGFFAKIGAMLLKPVFKKLKKTLDYSNNGGAVLMGISKPIVKGHGASGSKSIKACIAQVKEMVLGDVVGKITDALKTIE